MIDYRFTGRIGSDNEPMDIRLRTDAVSTNDQTFNITQIQVGQNFSANDKQDSTYLRWLSETFNEKNTTLGAMISFCMNNNIDLRSYDKNGNVAWVVNDASASSS